jgi:hypothetical protein
MENEVASSAHNKLLTIKAQWHRRYMARGLG